MYTDFMPGGDLMGLIHQLGKLKIEFVKFYAA